MVCKKLACLTCFVLLAVLVGSANAQDTEWDDGGSGSLWTTSDNWTNGAYNEDRCAFFCGQVVFYKNLCFFLDKRAAGLVEERSSQFYRFFTGLRPISSIIIRMRQ